mgnify:CR=1 FL=1
MRTIFFFLIIFFSLSNYSQERKSFDAVRFISPPKIDGKLNDDQWIKSPELKDFVLAFPSTRFGKKIPPDYETTAYFGYDDDAIYIAAKIKHPNMQEIQKELAVRDDAMNGDYELFWVSIDPYNNKEGHFGFAVSSSGVLNDGYFTCLLYTSPSPRDVEESRMPYSA